VKKKALILFAEIILIATLLAVASSTLCQFSDSETSSINQFAAWTSLNWTQTTESDFEAGAPRAVDTASSPGDVKLQQTQYLFAFQGNSTAAFWRYAIGNNTWTAEADAPGNITSGGAIVYDKGNYVYAFQGGSTAFWRYNINTNSWGMLPAVPAAEGAGAALSYAYDAGTSKYYLYALEGGSTSFWCYDVALGSWSTMAAFPGTVGDGGSLIWDGGDYIYALQGGQNNAFYRYSISSNSWIEMTATPDNVGTGASLVDSGTQIFAFEGNNTTSFEIYNIAGNNWTSGSAPLGTVNSGGSLCWDGSNYIYAFEGGSTMTFWRYDILSGVWFAGVSPAPGPVSSGGSICGIAQGYVSSGTLASAVFDTSATGTRWDALIWQDTLPANTTITFAVRASDTSYTKTDSTLPWEQVGGTSPVSSGLPTGRYMQWQATLTTSNISATPILSEAIIYYFNSK
jgi:predicted ribosomally synthesized peptide with SipW-like signal peptide